MDIVKPDDHILMMTTSRLFRDAKWKYYNQYGHVRLSQGTYLICDNGYLRWPTTICPFTRIDTTKYRECSHGCGMYVWNTEEEVANFEPRL